MALSRIEKENIVNEVKEIASNASSLVISDARGLKVTELSEIRKDASKTGIHIQVIKNSLAKLAFAGTDFGCSDEVLTGPSLFAFSFDEPGAAAKLLKSYAKNFEALNIKALVVEENSKHHAFVSCDLPMDIGELTYRSLKAHRAEAISS